MEREITTISFGKGVRLKRGMYSSADDKEALHLALREIYINSLDALTETNQQKGDIQIFIDTKSRQVKIQDTGPGIPIKVREDGSYSLVAAYTLPHTGSHNDVKNVNAIGTNGIGAALVAHTSSELTVTSCDGEKTAIAKFLGSSEGAVLKEYEEKPIKTPHGVTVSFVPDIDIYHEAWFDLDYLKKELDEMMKFYPKYLLTLNFDGRKIEFAFPNGLKLKDTKIYYESENFILSLGIGEGAILPFGNRLYLPNGGNFMTHLRTQMTKIVNDLSGLKLSGAQVQSVFNGYAAIFVTNPLFSNQSKTAISNKEVNQEITAALKEGFEEFSLTSEWENVIKKLEAEAKAEAAAEKARQKVLAAKKDFANKKINTMSEKFIDTDWKNRSECRLFLGEGTSATAPIKRVKWPQDATMELRGKIKNVCKAPFEKIIENKELTMIAKALGATLTDSGFLLTDKNLRFGKIILAADDDPDGMAIISLLMAFFYTYFPKLVKDGRLYTIAPKLFMATVGNERKFFVDEKEMKNYCKKNKTTPRDVARFKGRGSMNDFELKPLIDPVKGEYIQITMRDAKKAAESMKLMEIDIEPRRELINGNFNLEGEEE